MWGVDTPLPHTIEEKKPLQQNFYIGIFVNLNEIKAFIHSMYYLFARPLGALEEGGVEFVTQFFIWDFKRKVKKNFWRGDLFWEGDYTLPKYS